MKATVELVETCTFNESKFVITFHSKTERAFMFFIDGFQTKNDAESYVLSVNDKFMVSDENGDYYLTEEDLNLLIKSVFSVDDIDECQHSRFVVRYKENDGKVAGFDFNEYGLTKSLFKYAENYDAIEYCDDY